MGGSGHWRGSLLGSRGHTALLDLKPSGFSGSRVSPPSTAGAIMSPKGRLPTYLRTSFYDLERVGNVSLLGDTTQLLAKCGNPWGVVAVVVGVCVCVCARCFHPSSQTVLFCLDLILSSFGRCSSGLRIPFFYVPGIPLSDKFLGIPWWSRKNPLSNAGDPV